MNDFDSLVDTLKEKPSEPFPPSSPKNSANEKESPVLKFSNLPINHSHVDTIKDDSVQSFSIHEETRKNLHNYKRSLMLAIVIMTIFLGIIIAERIVSRTLIVQESLLLISFQSTAALGIDPNGSENAFYYLVGVLGEFHTWFLIQTHIFITIYVSIDAFIALKTLFIQFLGCYIISIFSIFYASPRPFWTDQGIRSYFCDATFSQPGEFLFQALFLLFYLLKNFKDSEEDMIIVGDSEKESYDSLAGSVFLPDNYQNKKRHIIRMIGTVCVMFLFLIFFFRYAEGLSYLHNYLIGGIFFLIIFTGVLFSDKYLSTLIKETTIMKNYARRNIFFWLIFLILAEALALLVQADFDHSRISLDWIVNFLQCQSKNYQKVDNGEFEHVLGASPTLQETTIIFGLVGAIFGANTSFQSISTLNWFKGPLRFKLIRALVANLCIIPSWALVVNQEDIVNMQTLLSLGGFDTYMINAVHFFVLYFFLFGILPTFVFNKFGCFKVDLKVPKFIPQRIF